MGAGIQLAGEITAGLAALAAIGVAISWIRRRWLRVESFLTDWAGSPARPGVPEQPGVLTRLHSIETRVDAIEREVKPNGGASMKDAVDRIAWATCNEKGKLWT